VIREGVILALLLLPLAANAQPLERYPAHPVSFPGGSPVYRLRGNQPFDVVAVTDTHVVSALKEKRIQVACQIES
jgi:hypothetical protein